MADTVTSLAVESARRAARAALQPPLNPIDQGAALAALHRTVSFEADAMGVELWQRINGMMTALATDIAAAVQSPANEDAARELLATAHKLARSQLDILLTLKRTTNPGETKP